MLVVHAINKEVIIVFLLFYCLVPDRDMLGLISKNEASLVITRKLQRHAMAVNLLGRVHVKLNNLVLFKLWCSATVDQSVTWNSVYTSEKRANCMTWLRVMCFSNLLCIYVVVVRLCVFAYSSRIYEPICTKNGMYIPWDQKGISERSKFRRIVQSLSPGEGGLW